MTRPSRPSPPASRRGLALILVLTVIMALAVIATPFVLSMIQQERTATVERAWQQAWYGAEGVRNFALTRVYGGTDGLERHGNYPGGTTTWQVDAPGEFTVDLRDDRLRNAKILDSKGTIWGVVLQDEQGKINPLSSPPRLLQNLRRLIDMRVVDPKDHLSIFAGRPARWCHPMKIRDIGTITTPAGSITGVQLDNVVHFGPGARVRVSKPGLSPMEATVGQNGRWTLGVNVVSTLPEIPAGYINGILELEWRHPVNVNTATRETLVALFEDVALTWPMTDQSPKSARITRAEATDIADALRGQNIQTWDQFVQLILNLGIDDIMKAAAILNALDPTNYLLVTPNGQDTGTMPLCFTSEETVTVLARSTISNPAGAPVSGTGFREVVDYAPPITLTKYFECQYDFDRLLGPPRLIVATSATSFPQDTARSLGFAGWPGSFNGFPFGSRVMTFPTALKSGEVSDMTLKPQPPAAENYVSMRSVHDRRGGGQWINTFEHFDTEVDGLKLPNTSYPMNWDAVFSRNPNQPAGNPLQNFPDVAAGGTEFWLRFDGSVPSNVRLFDLREGDSTNRVSLEVENKEIVYRITDATMGRPNASNVVMDKGWSEIRAPHPFVADTWFHIAIYWKGTRYGHMLLMIDGYVPTGAKWRHVEDETSNELGTELSAAVPVPPDPNMPFTQIPMKNTGWLQKPASWPGTEPWVVPLLIGGEVVEFDPSTGVGRRGARATPWQDHPAGAKVTLFGYSSRVRQLTIRVDYQDGEPPISMAFDNLLRANGKLNCQIGNPCQGSVNGPDDLDGDGTANDLLSTSNTIRFNSPDVNAFPQPGYILIGGEAIFYEKITVNSPTDGTFENCQRGAEGSQAADHRAGASIRLWGFPVDVPDPQLPTPTAIQFGHELFYPVRQTTNPTVAGFLHYWVGVVQGAPGTGRARPVTRDQQTGAHPQAPGTPLVPGFAMRESDLAIWRWNGNKYDFVTVIDAQNRREGHRVWNVRHEPPPPDPPGSAPVVNFIPDPAIQLAFLQANVSQDVQRDDLHTRVLKWPSGELPGWRWMEMNDIRAAYGPMRATIDELKNFASPKGHFALAGPTDSASQQLTVGSVNGMGVDQNNPAGAILAGEEIIGFAGFTGNQALVPCKRGWLNSTAQVHNYGDLLFNLQFLPVSALANPIGPEARYLPSKQILRGPGYNQGYALVGTEIIGFESQASQGAVQWDTLARWDGTGLFRGMYGTSTLNHQANTMVFGIPFRYWDGFKPGQFDNRMPYFQTAHTIRGARWLKLDFEADVVPQDDFVRVHAQVRADGLGELWTPNVDQKSSVWHFLKTMGNTMLDSQGQSYVGSKGEPGQLETRYLVEYRSGAYWPNHGWKKTMRLKEVKVDYDRETKVLFHEED